MNNYLQERANLGFGQLKSFSQWLVFSFLETWSSHVFILLPHVDVPLNHSVVLLLSVFFPKFYYGSLGMHPTSVNESLFMQPSFSTAYQQLNAVFPVSHPNVSIYSINKLFLSSSRHCGGVYICMGHLSNSSQWAFTLG